MRFAWEEALGISSVALLSVWELGWWEIFKEPARGKKRTRRLEFTSVGFIYIFCILSEKNKLSDYILYSTKVSKKKDALQKQFDTATF